MHKKYPVVTITGPRQSGKTTLVRHLFPKKAYVNLEHIETREFAQADPIGFLKKNPDGAMIDEVQRVPDLLSYIQVIVDEKKMNGQFLLTGSGQFMLMASITQSLAGRSALLCLLPFSIHELKEQSALLNASDFLYSGFYPRIHDHDLNPTQALGDYFETYVERDLRQLSQIQDQGLKSNLSFYRDSNGNEVDVIYHIAQHILPIEIKAGETINRDFFKAFKKLGKHIKAFPFGKALVYSVAKTIYFEPVITHSRKSARDFHPVVP